MDDIEQQCYDHVEKAIGKMTNWEQFELLTSLAERLHQLGETRMKEEYLKNEIQEYEEDL